MGNQNLDPDFKEIGDEELIDKRLEQKIVQGPGGEFADYIPFYFTPYSLMLYKITKDDKIPKEDIVIMVSSLREIANDQNAQFLFTDQHAIKEKAHFFSSLDDLNEIKWEWLQARNFTGNARGYYQAEALIYKYLDIKHLRSIICFGAKEEQIIKRAMENAGVNHLRIIADPNYYF